MVVVDDDKPGRSSSVCVVCTVASKLLDGAVVVVAVDEGASTGVIGVGELRKEKTLMGLVASGADGASS